MSKVQWWLAELGPHDLPKLLDGPHSRRSACNKAAFLINGIRGNYDARFVVARVELSDCVPYGRGVNQKAFKAIVQMCSAQKAIKQMTESKESEDDRTDRARAEDSV